MSPSALVTVGTTEFDDLIRGIDSITVLRQLVKQGFQRLVVQHGNGRYKIQTIHSQPVPGIHVECALPLVRRMLCHARCRHVCRTSACQSEPGHRECAQVAGDQ